MSRRTFLAIAGSALIFAAWVRLPRINSADAGVDNRLVERDGWILQASDIAYMRE